MSNKREWTKEQKQAIKAKGANILVSAAAGAGKTTVLVARIMNKILNEKVDIDKLLVATFTNAAASEMKERLLDKIYEEVSLNPDDENLQKQISLINRAHISTLHAFCIDVIKNNFYELGMSANFRIGDPTEIEILVQEAIEKVFEDKYEEENEEFLDLLEKYTSYKKDDELKEIITNLYSFIQTMPEPEKWLEAAVEEYNLDSSINDFSETKWGKVILENLLNIVSVQINTLEKARNTVFDNQELMNCKEVLIHDIEKLESINYETWDSFVNTISNIEFEKWPTKKISDEAKVIKDEVKELRDSAKKSILKIINDYVCTSEEAFQDIKEMYKTLCAIKNLVYDFTNEFTKRKSEKNIIGFDDAEHLALKLLVDDNGNRTDIAKRFEFNEVLVDEYQDISLIQETILNSVSNGKNIFMVGDVKQSIYRFRQSRPDLFLSKYNEYKKIEDNQFINDDNDEVLDSDTKILLYKNFRSRKNILDFSNIIFEGIMSKKLGEIDYNEEEYLNLGGSFEETKLPLKTELYVIDTKKEIESLEEYEDEDNSTLEARLIASKIKELVSEGVQYRDIAILMKSPNNVAAIYEKELLENNIPVFADTNSDYLSSIEIDTIIALLKVIDNPLQDIPLITVMRSPIGGFTDNDLIEIRLEDRNDSFYKAVVQARETNKKVDEFLKLIEDLKELENKLPLNELIWKIYAKTGYYHYVRLMPNGKMRQANLRKLFEKAKDYEKISYKGLFNFIKFIEKISYEKSKNGLTAAKIIGENDDVVRLMSIHKSKGLEFPIVILCGLGKRFNEQDLKAKIVYDQDMGFGLNYINDTFDYATLAKRAVNLKVKKELVSEEMRVLYVALTRAKDKLILIGAEKEAEKALDNIKKDIAFEKKNNKKIKANLVGKYNNYLDWIELVNSYTTMLDLETQIVYRKQLKEVKKDDIYEENNKIIENLKNIKLDLDEYNKIDEIMNWEYEYQNAIDIPSKTSVSAIKEEQKEIVEEKNIEVKKGDNEVERNSALKELILEKDNEIKATQKGTLIHLALQKMNNNIDETIDSLNILEEEREYLRSVKYVFENYLKSDLYKELLEAKEVYKETPFFMDMPYKDSNEKVLIQGIIDLYYIDKNDRLVLVDYKTDRVRNEKILIDRYKVQLDLYKDALKRSLHKDVDSVMIYSTELNKLIEIK